MASASHGNVLHGSKAYKPVSMDEWRSYWSNDQALWHSTKIHPALEKHVDKLIDGRTGITIFFPLCGKAVDMKWLYDQGHSIVGVDSASQPLEEFFEESSLKCTVDAVQGLGTLYKSEDGRIRLYCCDFYDFDTSLAGQLDGMWDSGGLMAINKEDREKFAEQMMSFMSPSTTYMMDTLEYDENEYIGPPYSFTQEMLINLYGAKCDVTLLDTWDLIEEYRDKLPLSALHRKAYLIKLRET